jgi:hypothetical protein
MPMPCMNGSTMYGIAQMTPVLVALTADPYYGIATAQPVVEVSLPPCAGCYLACMLMCGI